MLRFVKESRAREFLHRLAYSVCMYGSQTTLK